MNRDEAGVSARYFPLATGLGGDGARGLQGLPFCPLENVLVSQTCREIGREIWGYRTWVFLEPPQVTIWVLAYPSLV